MILIANKLKADFIETFGSWGRNSGRHICYKILRDLKYPIKQIAKAYNLKSPSTVLNSKKNIEATIKYNDDELTNNIKDFYNKWMNI